MAVALSSSPHTNIIIIFWLSTFTVFSSSPMPFLCEIIILLFNFFIIIIQVAIIGHYHPSWHDLITFHLITPFSLFLELLVWCVTAADSWVSCHCSLNGYLFLYREEDFGNYSCRAVNSLGRDQGHIVLSGTCTQDILKLGTSISNIVLSGTNIRVIVLSGT